MKQPPTQPSGGACRRSVRTRGAPALATCELRPGTLPGIRPGPAVASPAAARVTGAPGRPSGDAAGHAAQHPRRHPAAARVIGTPGRPSGPAVGHAAQHPAQHAAAHTGGHIAHHAAAHTGAHSGGHIDGHGPAAVSDAAASNQTHSVSTVLGGTVVQDTGAVH